MHFLLFYEAGPDYIERRAAFREEHLDLAWQAAERGELVVGGALGEPSDGSLLLFSGDSSEVAERFANSDPYVINGVVKRWYVRPWTTVVGPGAATPLRPKT
ncbi:MAG: YciI-like protein [Thermoanaerobaculia bacterium]